ncbi:serine palmitoyltransferase [Acrasis kona]|uniref:serine C-palmitoyltransferase n=1 Tax=Acrasis kona TaxID=1008807 RepID=A0AAW2YNR8_9EUKA
MTNCNPSLFTILTTYLNFLALLIFGHVRDFWRTYFVADSSSVVTPKGYAPLLKSFDDFYQRRMYTRIKDCWERPICSRPAAWIDIMERVSTDFNKTFTFTKKTIHALNLGSYNYLGFALNPDHVTKEIFNSLDQYGIGTCSPAGEFGYTAVHRDLEKEVAQFVGKEDSVVFSMGYATNSTTFPCLAGKGSLIISDRLNHTSIVRGARATGAKIEVFKHNNMKHLEHVIRQAIVKGQPKTRRPWKKIIIVVEGIYSMEGEMVDLKTCVELKKKYKCYLYVDEAHSIGAIGKSGKGICEHTGVDPADVDILMGTFTKSFGSVGGYVASSKAVINHIRRTSFSPLYGSSMPVACACQALNALRVITGEDGTNIGKERLQALARNSEYFLNGLRKLGFEVIADVGSPVIVVMLYNPGKMPGFSRECLKRGVAVVVVGAPATDILEGRVRFCLSANHTIEDLELALEKLSEVGDLTNTKYMKQKMLQGQDTH